MSDLDFEIEGFTFKSIDPYDFVVDSAVIPLFNKHKNILMDDYWDGKDESFRDLIKLVSPYFFVIFNPTGKFIGYIFLSDWRAGGTTCAFHIVIDDKYQGKDVKTCASKTADKLFEKFKLRRIDCTIPIYNKKVRAFAEYVLKAEFEGVQKARSIKNGKPLDYLMYAIVKGE
jgi:RimJ/RimL family protein N-acetyltransferase